MTIYLSLIWEFIKTGLFAIGGGLAALPFITDIGLDALVADDIETAGPRVVRA